MELIDTHSHIYLPDFNNDIDQVISRALKNNVKKILLPNIDVKSISFLNALYNKFPSICYPMMGLHPGSVKENYKEELNYILHELKNEKYIAVGEIGIDLYWDKKYKNEQIIVFEEQIKYAIEMNLPVIIHARESFNEIFEILNTFKTLPKGIFHAFTGNIEQANRIIEMGFKLGIGGIVTFKNSGLNNVIKEINLNHIVLETDSPYLAPVPYRGKRNESSYLIHIVRFISEIYNIDINEVIKSTSKTTYDIFEKINN